MVLLLSILWAACGIAGWAYVVWVKHAPHLVGITGWRDWVALPAMALLGGVGLGAALLL